MLIFSRFLIAHLLLNRKLFLVGNADFSPFFQKRGPMSEKKLNAVLVAFVRRG